MLRQDVSEYMSNIDKVLQSMWRNWAIAFGAITLPIVLSIVLPMLWIPFVCLFAAWGLHAAARSSSSMLVNSCSLVVRLAARTLFLSAFVGFAIDLLCTDWLIPTAIHFEIYNDEIPFITALIIYPIITLLSVWWLYMGLAERHCRRCQRRNGYYAGDSIVATLYYQEARYQVRLLLLISITLGAIDYWYYFFRYINANLNAPDRFFFQYIPLIIYLLSLVIMWGRYQSMRVMYMAVEDANPSRRYRTIVRFLVFCGNELLLHQRKDQLWDTPAELITARTTSIGDHPAKVMLEKELGFDKFSLRYCFTNNGFANGSIIIHYAAFIHQADKALLEKNDNQWFSMPMLDNGLATKSLAPVLANELYRIYTVTMAWKTYTPKGQRLYPIRHYKPTFRFCDMPKWTVDYDDVHWFEVAQNNEDNHFFHLRTIFNRLTDRIIKKTRKQWE